MRPAVAGSRLCGRIRKAEFISRGDVGWIIFNEPERPWREASVREAGDSSI